MKRAAICLLLLSVFVAIVLKKRKPEVIRLHGQAMGSSWTLAYEGEGDEQIRGMVAEVLERWEQVLSQWRETSDLTRYNRGGEASHELSRVLELAGRMKKETGAAFDFEMLEQVHEAGFGPKGKGVDLSALGKGYAVDRVGEGLRSLGVDHFVFELGGEVLVGEGDWKCGIAPPRMDGKGKVMELSRRAVATSGNYRQFRITEDGLISHIVDPRTGEPVLRPPCSVTVIANDCATADAWATALFVLGPEARPDGAPEFFWSTGEGR